MAVRRLELRKFTVFEEATIKLVDGVNVFLGANATGKTHALKALYTAVRALSEDPRKLDAHLADKLDAVFRPNNHQLGRLLHRQQGQSHYSVAITGEHKKSLAFSVNTRTGELQLTQKGLREIPCVFLPSREGLAMFEGFAAAYERRELAFDATYYDLSIALAATPLKGPRPALLTEVIRKIEKTIGGSVREVGGRFHLRGPGGALLEAHLMSEGFRKLGSVLRLIQNGELREAGLFLWDEPEANLNPELAVLVAELLTTLARGGVQVVVATHDYLLSETLSLRSEEANAAKTRFFCFERNRTGDSATVSHADQLGELKNNPIRAEFLRHYDRVRGAE